MTIGLDNELEQRKPHRTTLGLKRGLPVEGPWLVSWSSWANLLRFVPPEGIPLQDLRACPGVSERHLGGKNPGVIRWGYVTLSGGVVRPTDDLRVASETVFPYLPDIVEAKWADHLGASAVSQLKEVLGELLSQVDQKLPHYLPQADNLMWTRWPPQGPREEAIDELTLVDRLAQALLLYTVEHESASEVPLTMAANLLRVIDDEGTRTVDLVRRSGISKEAMGFLTGWRQRPDTHERRPERQDRLRGAGAHDRAVLGRAVPRGHDRSPALGTGTNRRRHGTRPFALGATGRSTGGLLAVLGQEPRDAPPLPDDLAPRGLPGRRVTPIEGPHSANDTKRYTDHWTDWR